ncbi:hypothetical protein C8R48DRAFT_677156 [Suillus tomentosus]|nr:hypothetical protein C8R48DRAFT_677156 [Suillus tomentosus]
MPAIGKTADSLGQTIGRHHVRFFLKNKCSSKVLSAIKHSSFFAPSVPSTLCPAHALLRDDPAQSSATVTADSTPVDLVSLSQSIDNITHHIVHSLSTPLGKMYTSLCLLAREAARQTRSQRPDSMEIVIALIE